MGLWFKMTASLKPNLTGLCLLYHLAAIILSLNYMAKNPLTHCIVSPRGMSMSVSCRMWLRKDADLWHMRRNKSFTHFNSAASKVRPENNKSAQEA